jgi:hypothetical protein
MRRLMVAAACAICAIPSLANTPAERGDDSKIPPVGKLVYFDIYSNPTGGNTLYANAKGDIVQLAVVYRTDKKYDPPISVRVKVEGEGFEVLGVLHVPAIKPVGGSKESGTLKQNISCFLRAVKPGRTKVSLTPIGMDGKDRATWYCIVELRPPAKDDANGK